MLKLIYSMSQLNCEQLMSVYHESNTVNAKIRYKECPEEMAIKREEEDFLSYLREDFFTVKGAFYAVWVVDGVYYAALRLEPYRSGLLLEALETAPNVRRKGYAELLMNAVINHLETFEHRLLYSHIRNSNIPSLGVHKKCGFRKISDTATLIDGTVTSKYCTMCLNLQIKNAAT